MCFEADGSYKDDLKQYSGEVLEKNGISSQTAEREILWLADEGNTVACKLYADLLFYQKIPRKHAYSGAFFLYLRSAGIAIDENGNWNCSRKAYPPAFWNVGYYLVNYRRESFLKECETIFEIERMTLEERLALATELSFACIREVEAAGAVNLIGRILLEAAENETIYEKVQPVLSEAAREGTEMTVCLKLPEVVEREHCRACADLFFEAAAEQGYVYACNNLALREADRILLASRDGASEEELQTMAKKYAGYLKRSADKYEPYAANRLGLYYLQGEIKGSTESTSIRAEIDFSLARDYFIKATVYPDRNSAWAYYNLIRYFYKDYTNDLDRLNEHMDRIRELNPEVYDLAMDL